MFMASGGGCKRAATTFTFLPVRRSSMIRFLASIFYSGVCQTWIHSFCESLSPSALEGAKNSGPFYCPSCHVHYQSQELSQLKQEFTDLSQMSRIASLEANLPLFLKNYLLYVLSHMTFMGIYLLMSTHLILLVSQSPLPNLLICLHQPRNLTGS